MEVKSSRGGSAGGWLHGKKNPNPKKQIQQGQMNKKTLLLHQRDPKLWVIRAPFVGWPTPRQGTVTPQHLSPEEGFCLCMPPEDSCRQVSQRPSGLQTVKRKHQRPWGYLVEVAISWQSHRLLVTLGCPHWFGVGCSTLATSGDCWARTAGSQQHHLWLRDCVWGCVVHLPSWGALKRLLGLMHFSREMGPGPIQASLAAGPCSMAVHH